MYRKEKFAFGWPGIEARWTSSAKSGVGTSYNARSKVWYSISHGILNEIYYPQVDQACTRDLSLIVTNGKDFFSEEKRHTSHHIKHIAKDVPGYHVTNSCNNHYYRIEKEIISDPQRDTLLQRIQFFPTNKKRKDFKLFMLLAPHLGNSGTGNTAWVGNYRGVPMLFAQRGDISLALACSVPWKKSSAGFVGSSDGWQDLMLHKQMLWEFERAENGNVAITGEIDLEEIGSNSFVVALGFGRNPYEAGQRARASIIENFENAKTQFISEWQKWQKKLYVIGGEKKNAPQNYFKISATMLRVHESKRHPGGLIASLSIPWGFDKGDNDIGGYHLVWPRDMVQTAGGLLAAKALEDARRVLNYLMVTQEEDGHWVQNMWLDGEPYWKGIQMDQTALPIMLIDLVNRESELPENELKHFWPMMRKAASYLVTHGPITHQDRWEENAGYSTFTLAVEISALLIAAEYAEINNEPQLATFLKETADSWNSCIERWTYVTGSDLAKFVGVDGYYVRINSRETFDNEHPENGLLTISNRPRGENICPASEMVSPDALALVRFGLRAANDERILNTIKVIDATLKMDHPTLGPVWYRYNRDGYGEKVDGKPFNGTGIGRPWPLLTGERGHYEVAAGNFEYAQKLLETMENYANETGMFPEQVWDSEDIPELGLYFGKPSGSAMPLAWAHAEYIKLSRSLKAKKIFDMPKQVEKRYLTEKTEAASFIWNFRIKDKYIPKGKDIRIHALACATVRWTMDNWNSVNETVTLDSGIGIFYADLPTNELDHEHSISFTFYWHDAECWEGKDFTVSIEKNPHHKIQHEHHHHADRDKLKVFLPS
ncbi:MAG: glucan 1,4-alpha-glucosidase [Bacteroidetes bacterium]|jgi:glucoamylase|nr:glucan 1,4-alpha-glucosidase [Bacteroidota bacterium]